MAIVTTTTTSEAIHANKSGIESTPEVVRTAKRAHDDRLRDIFRCTEHELAELRIALHRATYNLKYQATPLDPSIRPPLQPSSDEQVHIWDELISARRTWRDMLTGARYGGSSVVKPAGLEADLEDAKRELMIEASGGGAEGCLERPRFQDAACYVLRCTDDELAQLKSAIVKAEKNAYVGELAWDVLSATTSSDTMCDVIWKQIAWERPQLRDMLSCARWVKKPAALTWEMEVVKLNLLDDVFRSEPAKLVRLEMLYRDAVNKHQLYRH
ncbi:hypothetical protein Tdes44962_MAKER00124 [Teratosphaeria destructans]|uniref:Uncharacterized protein n=1 Tax=Teratosphaeria destructans TaxID=418781 RepID=A0A9W7W7A6_9PEZI|nr:hypothetical protein Tdes44962_MAKER00124 [Teratosphaeria destructans]